MPKEKNVSYIQSNPKARSKSSSNFALQGKDVGIETNEVVVRDKNPMPDAHAAPPNAKNPKNMKSVSRKPSRATANDSKSSRKSNDFEIMDGDQLYDSSKNDNEVSDVQDGFVFVATPDAPIFDTSLDFSETEPDYGVSEDSMFPPSRWKSNDRPKKVGTPDSLTLKTDDLIKILKLDEDEHAQAAQALKREASERPATARFKQEVQSQSGQTGQPQQDEQFEQMVQPVQPMQPEQPVQPVQQSAQQSQSAAKSQQQVENLKQQVEQLQQQVDQLKQPTNNVSSEQSSPQSRADVHGLRSNLNDAQAKDALVNRANSSSTDMAQPPNATMRRGILHRSAPRDPSNAQANVPVLRRLFRSPNASNVKRPMTNPPNRPPVPPASSVPPTPEAASAARQEVLAAQLARRHSARAAQVNRVKSHPVPPRQQGAQAKRPQGSDAVASAAAAAAAAAAAQVAAKVVENVTAASDGAGIDKKAIEKSSLFEKSPTPIEVDMKKAQSRHNKTRKKLIVVIAALAAIIIAGIAFILVNNGIFEGVVPGQVQNQQSLNDSSQNAQGSSQGSGQSQGGSSASGSSSGTSASTSSGSSSASGGSTAGASGAGDVTFTYVATTAAGKEYSVEETVTFQDNGDCEFSTMRMQFEDEATAKSFTDALAREYGSKFTLDSLDGANAVVTIDNSGLHLDRQEYENALRYSVKDLVVYT